MRVNWDVLKKPHTKMPEGIWFAQIRYQLIPSFLERIFFITKEEDVIGLYSTSNTGNWYNIENGVEPDFGGWRYVKEELNGLRRNNYYLGDK